MLYTLLGTSLGSAVAIAYLFWSRSRVSGDLATTRLQLQIANNATQGWRQSYSELSKTLSSKDAQIKTLGDQNAEYLEKLRTSGAPGVFADLLQRRNT